MNNRRSFIIGIKSTSLSSKEKAFIQKYKPWGIILFTRNIKSLKQTRKLTDQIKKIFDDKNYPILIDQEGGRVNRLKKFLMQKVYQESILESFIYRTKKNFLIIIKFL